MPEQLSDHTRASLKNRQCTHALALPVLNEQGELLGMVVVELRGLYLVGLPLEVWDAALRCVEELVRLGGPHVLREWPEEGVEDLIDAQMPVVGRRMAPLLRTLLSFIDYPEPILLEGETGVGKTHLARWVHRRSLRHGGPFEVVALQDLPENLIEAELFGWRRGAFTGATHDQAGAVSRASGGTLFLDDVQCLPLSVQYKLLRLVGERRWRPLGDSGPEREADLRILVGSNLDLSDLVRGGKFRMDLFYRLNGLRVKLPPLRARKDELLPLLRSFGAQARRQDGSRGPVELARGAERLLETATWSGNLRQLRSVVLRAVASVRPPAELGTTLTLREADLRWSLSMEPDLSDLSGGWQTSLEQAARDWAREALDRYEQDKPPLRLEQTEVFSAMVLRELVSRTETVSEAFRVLGEADLVRNRNQFRKWEEAQARIARFKGQGRPKE